ncbi:hypothetical protein ACEUZ9_005375 [Paracoccus litorisediminis]|uniref:hypothetical protein n=1 Tax=Paracoccus litorisediminis TaxID=2006130 RepID=UPI00372EF657
MSVSRFLLPTCLAVILANPALAEICDYRPSHVLGGATSASAATTGGLVAASGGAAKAAGVYTLVHSTSGLTMIGGTWAGSSAAGTAGIIAGTGGTIGSTVAVLISPFTIAAAAGTAIVVGGFEGACYFTDTRITDYEEINAIMRDIAKTAPDDLYRYIPRRHGYEEAEIKIIGVNRHFTTYMVKDLYIVNGVLMHRKWGRNTELGMIGRITDLPQQKMAKSEP